MIRFDRPYSFINQSIQDRMVIHHSQSHVSIGFYGVTLMNFSHIQFCTDKGSIDLVQLQELYTVTTFWAKNRTIEDIAKAIENSNPVVTVWDGKRLIGCARATSDGIFRATIWDVVIHPNYQGFGLGSKLVETLISHPNLNQVERIYLTTTHQQNFYKKIGFQENTTTTMVLYNRYPTSNDVVKESQGEEITAIV